MALANVHGVGAALFQRLVARFGTPQQVLTADKEALRGVHGVGEAVAHTIVHAIPDGGLQRARQELDQAKMAGARLVCLHDPDYPPHLLALANAPPYLYVLGNVACLSGLVLAVVGSRTPSSYGLEVTRGICTALATKGWTIVSGMARGIDTAAHFCALDVGAPSVGVAACGVCALPVDTFPSVKRLLADGVVVSEFAPTMPALEGLFPKRNRTMAGLALGTLVVEAGARSGALITANHAMKAGRPVFAVPGRIADDTSRGTNALIKRGARLVDEAEDILSVFQNEVARYGGSATIKSEQIARPVSVAQPVIPEVTAEGRSAEERAVLRVVGEAVADVDTLLITTKLSPAALATALLRLEIDGLVARLPGNRIALKR